MAKIVITNPEDLYTVQGDLVTENYELGLIGLKNPNNFIKHDERFMKIDTKLNEIVNNKQDKVDNNLQTTDKSIIGGINELFNGKSNNGHIHDDRYYTESEVDAKIKAINTVPVPVGGVLTMYNNTNPAELYSGTTWDLISSDKYIMSAGSDPLKAGGSNSFYISKSQLPKNKLRVDNHVHGQPSHRHITPANAQSSKTYNGASPARATSYGVRGKDYSSNGYDYPSRAAGGDNTYGSSPYTEYMGSGSAVWIQPVYIKLRFWKRTR